MKISLVLPARNEAPIIESTVRAVDRYLRHRRLTYEIIVGDAGSTDGTGRIVRELRLPNVRVITRAQRGKGGIISACFEHCNGSYVGFLDSDLEIDVSYVGELISALEDGYDAAIASKTLIPQYAKNRPISRRIATRVYNFLVRRLFGTPFSDHQAGLKLFRRQCILSILSTIENTEWLWDTEVLITLLRKGYRIKELPVRTRPRGTNKMAMGATSWQMLVGLLRLYRGKRHTWRG